MATRRSSVRISRQPPSCTFQWWARQIVTRLLVAVTPEAQKEAQKSVSVRLPPAGHDEVVEGARAVEHQPNQDQAEPRDLKEEQ